MLNSQKMESRWLKVKTLKTRNRIRPIHINYIECFKVYLPQTAREKVNSNVLRTPSSALDGVSQHWFEFSPPSASNSPTVEDLAKKKQFKYLDHMQLS